VAKIVSIHSYRGGTGKSNLTANLAVCLASSGRRVAVVDTDIQSPGIHLLFGLEDTSRLRTLNDYLWERCPVHEAATDVTPSPVLEAGGRVWLVPSSLQAGEIAKVLRQGYDVGLMNDGLRDLADHLALDYLLIDTHPGLNEETLLSIVVSHAVVIVFRPDQQDYEGTGITVQVARQLGAPRMLLVVNKVPTGLEEVVRQRVEEAYDCPIAAVIPHDDDLMRMGSEAPFVVRYPDHPLVALFEKLAAEVMA